MTIHEAADILNLHNYHGAGDWKVRNVTVTSNDAAEYIYILQAIEIAEQLHKYLLMCIKFLNAARQVKGENTWKYKGGKVYSLSHSYSIKEVIRMAESINAYT